MYNIIKCVGLPDYLVFKSECDCLSHDLHVALEKDDCGGISLKVFDDYCITDASAGDCWWSRLCYRFKHAMRLLFKGYTDIEYEFAFKDQDHINEFVEFLHDSLGKINEGPGEGEAEPADNHA